MGSFIADNEATSIAYVHGFSSMTAVERWMKDLGPGERICVVPRAHVPSFVNIVARAEMKIYTSFLELGFL
jgi:hypothetical protein